MRNGRDTGCFPISTTKKGMQRKEVSWEEVCTSSSSLAGAAPSHRWALFVVFSILVRKVEISLVLEALAAPPAEHASLRMGMSTELYNDISLM